MKKILWYTTIVLCAIFMVFSLFGVAGVWIARAGANALVNGLFDAADQAVAATISNIDEMLARRQEVRDSLQELSGKVDDLGSQIEETPIILTAMDKLMDGKLSPALQKLDGAGRRLYTGLSKLDAAVTTLNQSMLFRNRDGLLDEVSENLDSTMNDLDQLNTDFGILRTGLRERREEAAGTLVETLQGPIERMDTRLAESQSRLEKLNSRLTAAQSRLDATRQGILQLILTLAVLLTVLMLWLVFTQYLAIRYALVRIHSAPAKTPEPAAPPPPAPVTVEPVKEIAAAPAPVATAAPEATVEETAETEPKKPAPKKKTTKSAPKKTSKKTSKK